MQEFWLERDAVTVKTVKLGREKFVILSEKDYRELKRRASGKVVARSARQSSAEDRADMALALERLNDPREKPVPYGQVRKELGLV